MSTKTPAKPSYETCAGIKRPTANESLRKHDELVNKVMQEYSVCPLFERRLAEQVMVDRCSLLNNDFLACRWREFKDKAATRPRQPFKFPHISDIHFHNGYARYKPSESITNRTRNQFSMIPGPGIDAFGVIPLPNDSYNFRTHKDNVQKADTTRTLKKKQ